MNIYRTTIQPEPSKNKINYQSPMLFLGSCFTENIGNKLRDLKFPVIVNPFGVLYNPLSVSNGLKILIEQKSFTGSDLNFYNDQWYSFFHDTEYSDPDEEKSLFKINSSLDEASHQLREAKYLLITFGTTWVYKHLETNRIVSNCHKIPAKEFERFKLEPKTIFEEWSNLIYSLNEINKTLKIIFTVSPVRHWKDGAIQNQLSKSTLILAIHQLIDKFDNVEYFPAYEIMMDDLRDYRFYADDMIHPSNVAIDYIWDQFANTFFEKDTAEIIKEVGKIIQAKNHRPLNPETDGHKNFIKNQLSKIKDLSKKYSFLDLSDELKYFNEI